jgi:hypothetical protein
MTVKLITAQYEKEYLVVQQSEVMLRKMKDDDYISLTDIAKFRNKTEPFAVINNWMRSRSTIEFIGLVL